MTSPNIYINPLTGKLESMPCKFNYLDFNTSPVIPEMSKGRQWWNEADGTMNIAMGDGVNLQVGQEQLVKCTNLSGANIKNGQVVHISGAYGLFPTIELAQANTIDAHTVIGIATQDIDNTESGYVNTFGYIRGVDTTDFEAGDILYLSPTVAGGITTTEPVYPNHRIRLGYCITKDDTIGSIFFNYTPMYNSDDIQMNALNGPTYNTLSDFFKLTASPGRLVGGNVTENGGVGDLHVDAGNGLIRATDDDTAQIQFFDWAENTSISTVENSKNYIGVKWNESDGTPIVDSRITDDYDLDTEFPLASVVNDGGTLHILNNPWWVGDGITNVIERLRSFGYVTRDNYVGGMTISNPTGRRIQITGGTLWSLLNEFTIPTLDTSVSGTIKQYWYNGVAGTWNEVESADYSVTQWNDTTLATLQTLNNNWYANIWVYAEADDLNYSLIFPQAQYSNLASAQAKGPPTNLPIHVREHGILIGRMIIKEVVDAPVLIQSAFDTQFSTSSASDHGNLAGLSDDDHTQYARTDGTRAITGTQTIANIIDSGLTASSGVYADATKKLTSTAPTSGILGYFSRTGTTLSTSNAGDDISLTGSLTQSKALTGVGGIALTSGFVGTSDGTNDFNGIAIGGRNTILGTNWVKENSFTGLEFFGSAGIFGTVGNDKVKSVGVRSIGNFGFAETATFYDVIGAESYTTNLLNSVVTGKNGISNFVGQSIGNFFPTYDNNVGQLIAIPTFGTNNYQQILQGRGAGTGMFTGGYLLQPLADIKNSDFTATTPNWTNPDGNWSLYDLGFSNYSWRNDPAVGNTISELTSTYMKTGSIKSGKKYRVRIYIKEMTAGQVRVNLGTDTGTYRTEDGPYIEEFTANADDVSLFIEPSSTFDGAIDYIVIYPMEQFDYARIYSPSASKVNIAVEDSGTEADILEIDSDGMKITGSAEIGDGGTTNYTEVKADGEINLHGTARVYKNQWINVQGLKAPGTKPATLVDWGISCAWEFSNGTDDTICSSIRLPQDMDKTVAPEFKIGFASDTNTGDVVWQLEYLYLTPNEDTTAAAQETLTVTQTISGTADGLTIATITGMDLPSSTDQIIKMRIKRLGADGDDTLGDDCVLVGAGLKYVSNKLGVAL